MRFYNFLIRVCMCVGNSNNCKFVQYARWKTKKKKMIQDSCVLTYPTTSLIAYNTTGMLCPKIIIYTFMSTWPVPSWNWLLRLGIFWARLVISDFIFSISGIIIQFLQFYLTNAHNCSMIHNNISIFKRLNSYTFRTLLVHHQGVR